MANLTFFSQIKSRLKQFLISSRHHRTQGFTLLELLVVTAIAGGLVAGLMYIVVDLMGTDQREAARSETQREMQMALDYIGTELREAVYVYTGDALRCAGSAGGDCTKGGVPLTTYLPPSLSQQSVPVLAFWKQQPLPDSIKKQCANSTDLNTDQAVKDVNCFSGSSYALVVYSLAQNSSNSIWQGKFRITRYVLSQFNSQGVANAGYVNPASNGSSFVNWPFGTNPDTNASSNLQTTRPTGSSDTLVDFVDYNTTLPASVGVDPTRTGNCPANYTISPAAATLSAAGASFAGGTNVLRSFYACVSQDPNAATNPDIVLYLRGNAKGRPGISGNNFFLPALETRVMGRGVLEKIPPN